MGVLSTSLSEWDDSVGVVDQHLSLLHASLRAYAELHKNALHVGELKDRVFSIVLCGERLRVRSQFLFGRFEPEALDDKLDEDDSFVSRLCFERLDEVEDRYVRFGFVYVTLAGWLATQGPKNVRALVDIHRKGQGTNAAEKFMEALWNDLKGKLEI